MNNSLLYYSVGALLYCPANRKNIADSIVKQRFGTKYSLALCLEDTIRDDSVAEAEHILVQTLRQLDQQSMQNDFYVPKIFVRVRNARQIGRLHKAFGETARLITGYILPKFSLENADGFIQEIIKVNEASATPVYTMPIFESPSIIDLRTRYEILYQLKQKLDSVEDNVLNIRVGGNDLCHMILSLSTVWITSSLVRCGSTIKAVTGKKGCITSLQMTSSAVLSERRSFTPARLKLSTKPTKSRKRIIKMPLLS